MSTTSLRQRLERLDPYPEAVYRSMDLTGLAAFVLYWLQNEHIPTTFENVVVTLYQMFPERFGLEGFPEYPDAARVGRTLLQLGPKYRNWARGSVQKGFVLTQSGLQKVKSVQEGLLGGSAAVSAPTAKRKTAPRTMDVARDLAPLEESRLFEMWRQDRLNEGSSLDLLNMLDAYAYTPGRALRDRVAYLENAAAQVGRDDLIRFLRAVRKAFDDQFRDS